MINEFVPVFDLDRQATIPAFQVESFTITYRSPGPVTYSLPAYTRRVYGNHIAIERPFDANGFMSDWWNSMPQELKVEVFAVNKSVPFGESPFIAPSNFKEFFMDNANFSNVQMLDVK